MSEAGRGVVAMIVVCAVWGFSPIYYGWLSHVPPLETMCHRAIWSVVLFVAVLGAQGRLGDLGAALVDRRQLAPILAASAAIGLNWYLFILATVIDRVIESSLGYYIFPLVSVAAGRLVLKERLTLAQWLAVAIATLAVCLLGWGLGEMPLLALGLALTMTAYGLMKRFVTAGPMVSVTAEAIWVAPFALAWLLWRGSTDHDMLTWLLLAGAGPMTAIPLMLFTFAASRITMATQGFIMYLNPTFQALVATLVLMEPVTGWHFVTFPMIWAALAIYSVELIRQDRARRSATRAAASGTSVM